MASEFKKVPAIPEYEEKKKTGTMDTADSLTTELTINGTKIDQNPSKSRVMSFMRSAQRKNINPCNEKGLCSTALNEGVGARTQDLIS